MRPWLTDEVVSENLTWPALKSSSSNEPLFAAHAEDALQKPGRVEIPPAEELEHVGVEALVEGTKVGFPSVGSNDWALWLVLVSPVESQ